MLKKGFYTRSTREGTIFFTSDGEESLRAKLNDDNMQVMLFKPVEKLDKASSDDRLDPVKNAVERKAVFLGHKEQLAGEYMCDKKKSEIGEQFHKQFVHSVSASAPMNPQRKREEPQKQKASKKFDLNLMSIITTIIYMLTLGFGGCHKLQEGSPVIWRRNGEPAVIGHNSVTVKINLVSPCELLPLEGLSAKVVMKLRQKCDEHYELLFRGELEKLSRKNLWAQ